MLLDRLFVGQARLATDLGLLLAASLGLALGDHRRHRARLPLLIERDEHEVGAAGVRALPRQHVLGFHPNANLQ
jgi:hypothetical protein